MDGTPITELPALPRAENTDAAAVSNLVERLYSSSYDTRADLVRGLEPGMLLALARIEAEDHGLQTALAPDANRILRIEAASDPAHAPLLAPLVASSLSTNLLDQLIQVATSLATQSVAATITLQRAPWFDGTSLNITTNPTDTFNPYHDFGMDQPALVLMCHSQSDHDMILWDLDVPPPETDLAADGDLADMLSQLGVSMEDAEIPPEMKAQMAEAMARMRSERSGMVHSSDEDKADFVQTVDEYASGERPTLPGLMVSIIIALPPEESAAGINEDMEFNIEELEFE